MMKVFDSSSLKCYSRCPRKYYYRYVLDLVPLYEDPAPLNFGRAIHEALEIWYSDNDMDKAIAKFHEVWKDRQYDSLRTHESGEEILRKYEKEYAKETFELLSEPEQGFEIDIIGEKYVGRFDLVGHMNGMNLVIDHKTASRMGKSYYRRYNPDLQMFGYTFAAEKVFKRKFEGVLINVLYLTKTKRDLRRNIVTIEDFQKEEFLRQITRLITEIRANNPDNIHDWHPNWVACNDWGTCKYRDLCTSENKQKLMDSMYTELCWNPLEEIDESTRERIKGRRIQLVR